MLEVKDLNVCYGRAQILFDVGLTLNEGEVVAMLGRNGAGKSTTMKAIMGLVSTDHGQVLFDTQNITAKDAYQIARSGLGYVPEERRIFQDLTVKENLECGVKAAPEGQEAWTLEALFELFPNLAEFLDRPGGSISGGEQQMLTIARTLMGNPKLILLDEPSEGLAPKIVEMMAETILKLKSRGVGVLLSEQNLHFAGLVTDRAYIMESGHVCHEGTMSDILADHDLQNRYLSA